MRIMTLQDVVRGQQGPFEDAITDHDRGTGFEYWPVPVSQYPYEHCPTCGETLTMHSEDGILICWRCDPVEPSGWELWQEGQ